MASAYVSAPVEENVIGTDLEFRFNVRFFGPDIPGGSDFSSFTVRITSSDTLNTIRSKLSNAVAAEATRFGYSVQASAMLLPSYSRG